MDQRDSCVGDTERLTPVSMFLQNCAFLRGFILYRMIIKRYMKEIIIHEGQS